MNTFVARQPVIGRDQKLFAYELLFRSSLENYFPGIDGSSASSHVIAHSLSVFGPESLTRGRKAFINVTERILIEGLFEVLPVEWAVIEVLETVKPNPEVIAACRGLKSAGYELALDDFAFQPGYEPLIELADYIKIDFLEADSKQRRCFAEAFSSHVKLVAEKVETSEDVREGIELGYLYFQGYYFCEPEIVSRRDVPGFKLHYLRFLQEISRPGFDIDRLDDIFRQEVSLAVKLLRFLNSAAFGYQGQVSSVKQALILLGELPVRRWATMLAMAEMAEDKPRELILTCLVRARLCEELARAAGLVAESTDLFLVGMLSLLDALVGRPIQELTQEMAISQRICDGLLDESSQPGRILLLAIAQERADWDRVANLGDEMGIPEDAIPAAYAHAVSWASQVFAL